MKTSKFKILVVINVLAHCLIANDSMGASLTSVSNGNWNHPGTWSIGREPQDYDTIFVTQSRVVTLNIVTHEYVDLVVFVDGRLHFNGGKKLRMCNGKLQVSASGEITAGNNGSKLDLCGNVVWTGNDPGNGPLTFSNMTTLPIELVSFTADATADKNVLLKWKTASETNNDYFLVERTINGTDFEGLKSIGGAGTTSATTEYSYTDNNPLNGTSFYRLKQTDYDGKFSYSRLSKVVISNSKNSKISIRRQNDYSFTILLPHLPRNSCSIFISNFSGKILFHEKINKSEFRDKLNFQDALLNPNEIFLVCAEIDGNVFGEKFYLKD